MSQRNQGNRAQRTAEAASTGAAAGGPWGAVIGAVVANAGGIYRALGGGGTRDLKAWERQQLYDAGFRKTGPNRWEKTNTVTGTRDVIKSRKQAIRAAKELKIIGALPPIPADHDAMLPPLIALPGGASAVDVLGRLPGYGSTAARVGGFGVASLLLWPSTAGEGSDLREYWMKNAKPAVGPRTRGGRRGRAKPKGRRGRRPRAIAKPKVPVTWAPGRGGPVTISRGRARSVPAPVATTYTPKPGGELADAGSPGSRWPAPTRSRWPAPTRSRAVPKVPVAVPGASVWTKLGLPTTWKDAMDLVTPYLLQAAFAPKPTRNPAWQPSPALAPQPLTQAQSSAVPYAVPRTATQSCSCAKTRTRRKNSCRNPVTKRKRETRGGHKFVTTTKRLDCERGRTAA